MTTPDEPGPRDEQEARDWYCAAAFTDPKWAPSVVQRRRPAITRETVAGMIARAAAAAGPYVPPRIQQPHQRTAADRRRIAAAMDYINSLQ